MRPAALANLVRGLHIDAVPAAHPLDQLPAKLGVAGVRVALRLHLLQPLARPANDQIVKSYTLASTSQRI
jgi:hypothetical protein